MLESPERKRAVYGEGTRAKPQLVKAQRDPANLSRVNHSVEPAV